MVAARDLTRSLQRALTHLDEPKRRGGKHAMPIPTHFRPAGAKHVQVKDRIPYWNIAPGDRVKIVKGGADVKDKVGTVDRVYRESNRITLKEDVFRAKKRTPNQYPGESLSADYKSADATVNVARSFHVANARLQIQFPDGVEHTATRVRRSKVSWDRRYNRFHWERMGLVKELAGEGDGTTWYQIKWPKEEEVRTVPGERDATETTSLASTWIPDLSALSIHASPTSLSSTSAAVAPPAELTISPIDLRGGYHSRAARTKRFNEEKEEKKQRGKEVRDEAIERRRKRDRSAEIQLA